MSEERIRAALDIKNADEVKAVAENVAQEKTLDEIVAQRAAVEAVEAAKQARYE